MFHYHIMTDLTLGHQRQQHLNWTLVSARQQGDQTSSHFLYDGCEVEVSQVRLWPVCPDCLNCNCCEKQIKTQFQWSVKERLSSSHLKYHPVPATIIQIIITRYNHFTTWEYSHILLLHTPRQWYLNKSPNCSKLSDLPYHFWPSWGKTRVWCVTVSYK